MSFVGDLEHLPIVDVIQLLHATRKSGTLCLKSQKGESQLVFSDGCIVSANHSNNSVRIGQILVQMNAITRETLDSSLAEQKSSGAARIPLIASLIESGKLKKEDAFKGLETLIELTIVEVLTWTEGIFELDVDTTVISDEYRYIPEKMKLELNLNTQNVLMDALRIYDEKKRDGTLMDNTFQDEEVVESAPIAEAPSSDTIISIDDLGLDVMDDLEKAIPGFFTPVRVHEPSIVHREKLGSIFEDLPPEDQARLFTYLSRPPLPAGSAASPGQDAPPTQAMILFSSDEFISHTVMTRCKQENFFTFSTDEEENLDHIISQSFSKELLPVLLIDSSKEGSTKSMAEMTRKVLAGHPGLIVYHLVEDAGFDTVIEALNSGARAVLPKPDGIKRSASFVDDSIRFLEMLNKCVRAASAHAGRGLPVLFKECMDELSSSKELAEITNVIDRYISSVLARAVTFTSRKSELTCTAIARSGTSQPLSISMPGEGSSPLHAVIANGNLFVGEGADKLLEEKLYCQIEKPLCGQILVAPLKCLGRVVAVTYADFGSRHQADIQTDLICALMRHAGLVYENALYRKKFEKMLQSQQQ